MSGNRTPGICVTGRDVTNYTIADPHDVVLWEEKNIFCLLYECVRSEKEQREIIFFSPPVAPGRVAAICRNTPGQLPGTER